MLMEGTTVGVSTGADGSFELRVPAELVGPGRIQVRISSIGYFSQLRVLAPATGTASQIFRLRRDVKGLLEAVVIGGVDMRRPWPWHPRRFYHWGKYWLTRPFQNR